MINESTDRLAGLFVYQIAGIEEKTGGYGIRYEKRYVVNSSKEEALIRLFKEVQNGWTGSNRTV